MNWKAATATRACDSEDFWHSSGVRISHVNPFLFSVERSDGHVSDLNLFRPGIILVFDHVVENHETPFRSDWNHLKHMKLLWNCLRWLRTLSNGIDVLSDLTLVLVQGNDRLYLVRWSKANVTDAENVFQNVCSWLVFNLSNWVNISNSSVFINHNLI
jgi:hypothetical protein